MMPRIAVVGHVEHVTVGRVDAIVPGDVLHLRDARVIAAGGGGIAFAQLVRSDAEVHFFTAIGRGDTGDVVAERIRSRSARVQLHVAAREVEHPPVVVLVDGEGRRTIVVTSPPLQPSAEDPLPWPLLETCDTVYFTGADPASLRLARRSRCLVVAARRGPVLRDARVAPDVVVGSVADPREDAPLDAYEPAPGALVLTDGPRPVRITREAGTAWIDAPPAVTHVTGDYGAGDSFAAALTFFLAHGATLEEACREAGPYGAAVLGGIDPIAGQARLFAPAAALRR